MLSEIILISFTGTFLKYYFNSYYGFVQCLQIGFTSNPDDVLFGVSNMYIDHMLCH